MSAYDKPLKTTVGGILVPQGYNPDTNEYEAVHVKNGALKVTGDVQLTGSIVTQSEMEIYGPTIAERPDASSVPVGACYMAVNSQEVWQSNGTDWVVASI